MNDKVLFEYLKVYVHVCMSLWISGFLCLMAFQTSWVILCQSIFWRKTEVVLLNSYLGEDKEIHTFPMIIKSKLNVIA